MAIHSHSRQKHSITRPKLLSKILSKIIKLIDRIQPLRTLDRLIYKGRPVGDGPFIAEADTIYANHDLLISPVDTIPETSCGFF